MIENNNRCKALDANLSKSVRIMTLCYTEWVVDTAKQLCWSFCFKYQKAKLLKECMDSLYYSESYWSMISTCKKAKTRV